MEKFTEIPCVYVPGVDIAEVNQFGAIDLRSAFLNHSIPENVSAATLEYNEVDDPASLLGRASDVFDAIRKANFVASAGSPDVATEGAQSTSGESE